MTISEIRAQLWADVYKQVLSKYSSCVATTEADLTLAAFDKRFSAAEVSVPIKPEIKPDGSHLIGWKRKLDGAAVFSVRRNPSLPDHSPSLFDVQLDNGKLDTYGLRGNYYSDQDSVYDLIPPTT